MALILASASPRRRELLRMITPDFQSMTADIDESMDASRGIPEEVCRISRSKAEAVLPRCCENDIIVSADTIVTLDGIILGKPKNEEDAFRTLRLLSGRSHRVLTGVTVCSRGRFLTQAETTEVTFRPLSDSEIRAYIALGEPMDKAGSYGIQDHAALFVSGISGDYYNVVGLPLCRLSLMLREFGFPGPSAPVD